MHFTRSSRALALLLALPSAAFALGLGDIHLLSPLNAPLNAEIELVDVAPDEMNTLQAQLASRETFARYGLDWPGYLSGVQVHTERTGDGRAVIRLKSVDAISDPFVTLLVEVNWARGRLVREYTVLLDPPVYAPGPASLAAAPVSAPATGAGTHEGAIARAQPSPPAEGSAAEKAASAAAAAPAPAAATAAPAPAAASSGPGEGSEHLVRPGEVLSRIAASAAGESANSPRARSWMLAIYQGNPHAFDRNMNLLRSGAVLRMPDPATVAAVSPSEATAELRRQTAAWRAQTGETGAPAQTSGTEPGRLKLVTPSQAAAAGATPGAPSGEVNALQGRVHDLESQLADSKRLIEMKNAELARLQAQLAASQAAAARAPATAQPPAAAPAPQAPLPPPPSAAQQAPPPAPPPAAEVTPPPAPAPVTAPEEKAPQPAPPPPSVAQQPPAPKAAAARPRAAPPTGSLIDTLLGYWWLLLVVALALVAFIASRIIRSRRASEFDDSLGRLAVAGAGADLGLPPKGRGSVAEAAPQPPAPPPPALRPVPVAEREGAFLVEETGTHERPRLGGGPAPAPKHVATEDTISSETAINLDQGDPLAEADFHMAYGLYDQAADLIRIAISREPARRDLKLKLLEVFFVWGNKEQFLQTARELADTRAEAAPGEWEKILIMGKQLAPEDPLFSGAGAVSGATAAGVDLDLEGGQSRVDFDLLGEPVPGEAGPGVDLDIGAAVGDRDATIESTTSVTDRNAALLEQSFLGTTGTTRQMTARVSDVGSATGELEGPTVEQPAALSSEPTVRQKLETAMRQGGTEQTAELAIDDLGLEVGPVDTVDQPGPASAAASSPDAPTLVAPLGEASRQAVEDTQERAGLEASGSGSTGAWQFDQSELEAAVTQTSLRPDISDTARLAALGGHAVDVDVGEATGMHRAPAAGGLDLDVGTATVPDSAFAATQRLSSEELALPDLEPVTMSEVGTKLDLARAYMDMGDPDGARNILEEVLNEGSAAQKQEAQRLMESLPG